MQNPRFLKNCCTQRKTKTEKIEFNSDTIIIAGTARLPENVTAKHVFGYLTIELEVNRYNCEVVDVSCTLLPSLGRKMLRKVLLNRTIDEGIKDGIKQLNGRFSGATKKAMIAALEDAYRRYEKFREKLKGHFSEQPELALDN